MNPKLVNRIVGYLEYAPPYLLDQLVKNCSKEELAVVETLVRSRDEYAVYVNRSQILERESSTLSEQPLNSSDEFEPEGSPG